MYDQKLTAENIEAVLKKAEQGISGYLKAQTENGEIAPSYAESAEKNVLPNLAKWLKDESIDALDPNLRLGIADAVEAGRWEDIVNTYLRPATFSATGGIRAKMSAHKDEIMRLKADGIAARILKGPNSINNLVLLLTATGVARYGKDNGFKKFVVGFDSRVRGKDLAQAIASALLAHDFRVYLFDEACMFPNVSFAVPQFNADCGIFISASHNDYRYNGFKITAANGGQMENAVRNKMYDDYIAKMTPSDIRLADFKAAEKDRLWMLGGTPTGRKFEAGEHAGFPVGAPQPDMEYFGREDTIIDIHSVHVNHMKKFLLDPEFVAKQKESDKALNIAYAAFHGSGRKIVPWLLSAVGFREVKKIMKLDALDGLFPSFNSAPGKEQQPDPGDERAGDIAVAAFKEEYPGAWADTDLIVGTDPDADRCGVVVRLSEEDKKYYGGKDYLLMPADDVWALVVWYRLFREKQMYGEVRDREKRFVGMTHTTNDIIRKLGEKFGIGVMKTWVGFVMLSTAVTEVWRSGRLPNVFEGREHKEDKKSHPYLMEHYGMDTGKHSFNLACVEQSAGMTIFGGLPADNRRQMGVDGHVRDKDGTFAALLLSEVAAYAKSQGKTLLDMMNELYCDPEIGLFVNYYEPDPLDGEFPGLRGESKKRDILMRVVGMHEQVSRGDELSIGGIRVTSSIVYWTGKYDKANWDGFPDEGIRFYFNENRLSSVIVRPSGTSNSLRFHVQLHEESLVDKLNVRDKKAALLAEAKAVVDDLRAKIGAPRE